MSYYVLIKQTVFNFFRTVCVAMFMAEGGSESKKLCTLPAGLYGIIHHGIDNLGNDLLYERENP